MNKRCIGCGAPLNNDEQICRRCFRLQNYGEYQEPITTNEDYLKIISKINKDELVIYVTSLLNININYLEKFNNVILVLTKKDLLPKSVQDYKLIKYFKDRYPNFKEIEVISSIKNYHLDELYHKIIKHQTSKNVYVIGYTNSGKSTLINKLIKNYSDKEPQITTSIFPSTTIDKINIPITNHLTIIDTPGIVSPTSIINHIDHSMLKKITPKKTIKPRTYQIKGKGSLIIENLLRLDYDTKETSMTIYISNSVNIIRVKPNNPKMQDQAKKTIFISDNEDLIIEDLCFIKFTKRTKINIYTDIDVGLNTRDNLIWQNTISAL